MTTKHTPGPWRVTKGAAGDWAVGTGDEVAYLCPTEYRAQHLAHMLNTRANLLAALEGAVDLLEKSKMLLEMVEPGPTPFADKVLGDAYAAIARAKGEKS